MSSQGKSYAVDSDLQGEIHSVIPKDPYHQQNLHRKRTSKATAYVASSPESDVSLLHRKLLEKDRIIGDLEERISNLTLTSQQAHSSLNTALEENVKFSKERDELAATMKNLRRDISKARLLKTENLGRELTDDYPDSMLNYISKTGEEFEPEYFRDRVQGDIQIDEEGLVDLISGLLPLSPKGSHEPKSWSHFAKLAQKGIDNVSLIDQDHLGFQSVIGETVDSRAETSVLTDTQFHAKIITQEHMDNKFEANTLELERLLGDFPNNNTIQVIENEDLEELEILGSGTFGTVYRGKWRGANVAIKKRHIRPTGRSSKQKGLTDEREANILSTLHHPNVVALYGVVHDELGRTMATVTELMMDGSLSSLLLRKDGYIDRYKRLIIAMDIAIGMEYLHSKNVVHFDLKCDNVLVNLKDHLRPICKICDFGLSKYKPNTFISGNVRGTLPWMVPELHNGERSKITEKIDVFSFGIVLWEILTGEVPYGKMPLGAVIGGIVNNRLRPTIPSHCGVEWRTLMEQCWTKNPVDRPSFTEIAGRLRKMYDVATSETKA